MGTKPPRHGSTHCELGKYGNEGGTYQLCLCKGESSRVSVISWMVSSLISGIFRQVQGERNRREPRVCNEAARRTGLEASGLVTHA